MAGGARRRVDAPRAARRRSGTSWTTLRSRAAWLSWSSSESATPRPTAAATGSSSVATNVAHDGDLRLEPGAPDGGDGADAQRADGGEDEQRGEGRHGDGADDARERGQDQQQPQAGEDRRPAGAGTGGAVERRLTDGSADGLALEEAGAQVAHALGDEVVVGVGARCRPRWESDSATPTPWTSTIAATASAPTSSDSENADHSGHAGSGIPRGSSPWSWTWATSASVKPRRPSGPASRDDRRRTRRCRVRRAGR